MLNSRSQLGTALLASLFLSTAACAQTAPSPENRAQALFDTMAAQYPALNATVMVDGTIAWEAEGGMNRLPGDGVAQDLSLIHI